MISSGKMSEAFKFLTGAPAMDFATNTATVDELWAKLTVSLKKKHVITASCFNDYQGIQAGSGLIVKGFYSLRRGDGSMIRLLKLRYPWKTGETEFQYKGKFGPQDKSWTDEVKKTVGYDRLDKSEFFMTVEAFKYAFKNFMVGYHYPEWRPTFVEKRNAVAKKVYRFNFTITDEDFGVEQQENSARESDSRKEYTSKIFREAADAERKAELLDAAEHDK